MIDEAKHKFPSHTKFVVTNVFVRPDFWANGHLSFALAHSPNDLPQPGRRVIIQDGRLKGSSGTIVDPDTWRGPRVAVTYERPRRLA